MSSVYDVLEEKFIENGDYEKLPGNQQTLRNYIHYLEDSDRSTGNASTAVFMIMFSIHRPGNRC